VANVFGREGYPLPYFHRQVGADGATWNIQVGGLDEFRTGNISNVDFRLEKEFALGRDGDVSATLTADAFNVFNEDFVLQRERQLGQSTTNFTHEILSPRVWRLGVRLNFR
jgi:hypothetical protein